MPLKAMLLSAALQLFESSVGAERNKHLSDRAMPKDRAMNIRQKKKS